MAGINPNHFNGMRPQIILLRDGTDESQGKAQLVSNINACQAVAEAVRTTLGPKSMLKMLLDPMGGIVLTNDGNAILREVGARFAA